jgi:hypothetical protein
MKYRKGYWFWKLMSIAAVIGVTCLIPSVVRNLLYTCSLGDCFTYGEPYELAILAGTLFLAYTCVALSFLDTKEN